MELIRYVRNHAAHQGPLISAHPDQQAEAVRFASYLTAIDTVARNINPDAADWIAAHSRVPDVIAQRPHHRTSSRPDKANTHLDAPLSPAGS